MSAGPASEGLPDAPTGNLFYRFAPETWRPFIQLARIDRPIGWWLLLLPCWWSSALAGVATGRAPNLWHLALFLIGAVAMRGAGSTYNDLVDSGMDAQVERTKGRPLPSGRVTPGAAKIFLVAQSLIGLIVLLQFNAFAIALGIGSLLIVAVYPFMKRVTSWPQAVLGLAFAWGGLMGWACLTGGLAAPAFLIYAAAIAWTMGYDTVYALQDARDDAVVGIRSTARLFGARVVEGVSVLYGATLALAALALWAAGAGVASWLGWAAFGLHLAWQMRVLSVSGAARALMLFRANRDAGLLLFAGLAADAAWRSLA